MFLTVDNSENEFNMKARLKVETKHGGQTGRQMWLLRNYFCSFYLFKLKVCRIVGLCIPNNCMFFVFRF